MRGIALKIIVILALAGSADAATFAPIGPCEFTRLQTDRLFLELDTGLKDGAEASESRGPVKEIHVSARRNEWLREVYGLGIVETSEIDRLLWSKTITAELLTRLGTNPGYKFFPKTIGLKCFLASYTLLGKDNGIDANREQIRIALKRAFPNGFVVMRDSPTMLREDNLDEYYRNPEIFLDELLKSDSTLYKKGEYAQPFYSKDVEGVTSGEKIILQESILEPGTSFVEARAHALEHRVVEGAIFPRFEAGKGLSAQETAQVRDFVDTFLAAQPKELTRLRAWSLDVAVLSNGKTRVLHILTNRGNATHWSKFQSYPSVLGAYTRHIEAFYNVKFTGISGFLLRNNLGNLPRFLRKKLIDGTL